MGKYCLTTLKLEIANLVDKVTQSYSLLLFIPYELVHDKTIKWTDLQAKSQTSLGINKVIPASSSCS